MQSSHDVINICIAPQILWSEIQLLNIIKYLNVIFLVCTVGPKAVVFREAGKKMYSLGKYIYTWAYFRLFLVVHSLLGRHRQVISLSSRPSWSIEFQNNIEKPYFKNKQKEIKEINTLFGNHNKEKTPLKQLTNVWDCQLSARKLPGSIIKLWYLILHHGKY